MKKLLIVMMSVLLVVSSLVTGVFALYTSSVDDVTTGAAAAKHFVITGAETQTFGEDAKIAPTETISSQFTVANFEGEKTTEVNMTVSITITFTSTITPLTISLVDADTSDICIAATSDATSTYSLTLNANTQTTKTYNVVVNWPSTANDIDFESGTASFQVDITGTQAV